MSKLLSSEDFGKKLYNTLPPSYRTDDALENFSLKRYLNSLSDGGYSKVIDEINGILTLVDPDKIDAKLLPILFENYGMEIFNSIPELYLRKLLPMVSELYSLKGTVTAVEYLTSIISGVKSTIEVESEFEQNHSIDVRLEMDYEAEGSNDGLPDREQLLRIIKEFVPFFCDVVIFYVYMFYELGQLSSEDVEEVMNIEQSLEDSARLYSNMNGYFPLLNDQDITLNNTLITNYEYLISYEPDQLVKDILKVFFNESASLTSDCDVVYDSSREIRYESEVIYGDEIEKDTLLEVKEETCEFSSEVDSESQIALEYRNEEAILSTQAYTPMLNLKHMELNSDFVLNSVSDLDTIVVEVVTFSSQNEVVQVTCEEKELVSNTTMLQEETSVINSSAEVLDKSSISNNITDKGDISNDFSSTLSNMALFTLNTSFFTNGSYDYDKITQSGETRVIFSI